MLNKGPKQPLNKQPLNTKKPFSGRPDERLETSPLRNERTEKTNPSKQHPSKGGRDLRDI